MNRSISLVIPTFNAGRDIVLLLDALLGQTVVPREIIVIDSSSDDDTRELIAPFFDKGVSLEVIDRKSFNHGGTRHLAFSRTTGDYVLFMTQDAIPASPRYIESLIKPFSDDGLIALVSGRQLPKQGARRFEQLVREFNYPDEPSVRSLEDLPRLGIKTYFASDVCAAYRRDAYLECGGFDVVDTNEDMLMASRLIASGYKVAYQPAAAVFHSHNFTPLQQFKRNREVGAFLASHPTDFKGASEVGEGGRLVRFVSSSLVRERRFGELVAFYIDCAARLAGNRIGRKIAAKYTREPSQ